MLIGYWIDGIDLFSLFSDCPKHNLVFMLQLDVSVCVCGVQLLPIVLSLMISLLFVVVEFGDIFVILSYIITTLLLYYLSSPCIPVLNAFSV